MMDQEEVEGSRVFLESAFADDGCGFRFALVSFFRHDA
jgi:hypothetical protein